METDSKSVLTLIKAVVYKTDTDPKASPGAELGHDEHRLWFNTGPDKPAGQSVIIYSL